MKTDKFCTQWVEILLWLRAWGGGKDVTERGVGWGCGMGDGLECNGCGYDMDGVVRVRTVERDMGEGYGIDEECGSGLIEEWGMGMGTVWVRGVV